MSWSLIPRRRHVHCGLSDYVWGSVDRTELTLRCLRPWDRRWCDLRLTRENWWVEWGFSRDANCRCYCPVGWMARLHVAFAGWKVIVWLSRYGGDVPCHCDQALSDFAEDCFTEETAHTPKETR